MTQTLTPGPAKRDALKLLNVSLKLSPLTDEFRAFLERFPVGGVCLFRGTARTLDEVVPILAELRDRLGPEALVAIDQEGGSVVRLPDLPVSPGAFALGVGDDAARTERVSLVQARALAALGINVNFAPVLDVNNNPANPVIGERSFGETPDLAARHGVAFVRGHLAGGVMPVGKHFPGHGDTAVDSHLGLPVLDRDWAELEATELVPFRAAFEAGLPAIMTAHIVFSRLSARPATLSPEVLGHLRRHLGFDGLVFTDALDMRAILDEFPQHESAALSLAAGADIPLVLGTPTELGEIAARFDPDPAFVRRSLARFDRARERFPYRAPDPDALAALLADPASWTDIEDAARAALRPQDGAALPLPLPKGARLLALVPAAVKRGAAADEDDLRARLEPVLRAVFPNVEVRVYGPDTAHVATDGADAVLLVSANRVEPLDDARRLARSLAGHPRALHANLFNPYLSRDFPLPTLLTLGYRDASLRALAAVLAGGLA